MSGHVEELGDALGNVRKTGSSDPQREYYMWKLMRDKYAVAQDPNLSAEAKKVLGAVSEKEAIKFKILEKIQGDDYSESSANYAQLCQRTGETDKLAQAEWLAERIYEQEKDKAIIRNLTGNKATFEGLIGSSGANARRAAYGGGGIAASVASVASSLGLGGSSAAQ